MIQEYKNILLRDLCARMPYEVKCKYYNVYENCYEEGTVLGFERKEYIVINGECIIAEEVRPYLFPLSSINEEQWRELFETAGYEVREEDCGRHTEMYYYDMVGHENTLYPNCDAIDWLNTHHFDYRGLIEKGLAIDATGKGIY